MDPDRKIGRVVKVKTYQALVELLPDTNSYIKNSYGGLYSIATINSYVILPIGSERVVAVVTSLDMAEDLETGFHTRKMLVLPTSRRTMWISMIGTISQKAGSTEKKFEFGIGRYPELDNAVWFAAEEDLDVIFEKNCTDPDRAKRLISIGRSPIFSDYDVKIDLDCFLGKHAAILGNTGSGKSCTVAAIINAVMNAPNGNGMPHAHFVIFDTNAEYEAAFTRAGLEFDGDAFNETLEPIFNRLVIKNEGDIPSGLWIPHWFMNGRDYTAFFRPGDGAQGPLLHKSIGTARASVQATAFRTETLIIIENSLNGLEGMLADRPTGNAAYYGRRNLRELIADLQQFLGNQVSLFESFGLEESLSQYRLNVQGMLDEVGIVEGQVLPTLEQSLREKVLLIRQQIASDFGAMDTYSETPVGIDTPVHFDFTDFVRRVFREELAREGRNNPALRNWVGTLLLRLEQAKNDPRYSFLFRVPPFKRSLASFLRLILGVDPGKCLNESGCEAPWKENYVQQCSVGSQQHNVTILDFSQLASDVLENVTALIGRLILEFMQRCPQRGDYPIVLVLEEAHHYIPAQAVLERQQRAREVFERIAKEGRKYGLSLLIASQRPSELSKTVLAQCNSFIVHRIQNPDDREYFKSVISGINRDLLEQLPALPQQHALVIGDCITIPLQVKINDVDPKPKSKDPEFFKVWSNASSPSPNFEDICAKWEGTGSSNEPQN